MLYLLVAVFLRTLQFVSTPEGPITTILRLVSRILTFLYDISEPSMGHVQDIYLDLYEMRCYIAVHRRKLAIHLSVAP